MPRTADWFSSLTKKAQKEYIAKHPNSKYAKGNKAKPATATKTSATRSAVRSASVQAAELKTKVANFRAAEKAKLAKSRKSPAVQAAELKTKVANFRAAEKEKAAKKPTVSSRAKARSQEKKDRASRPVHQNTRTAAQKKEMASRVTTLSAKGGKAKTVSAKTVKTAHDKKRITDKNKVVAKTPSAKKAPAKKAAIVKPISGKTPAETKLKQRIAGLRLSLQMQKTGTPEYKRRKAQYDKLREQLKAMKK